MSPDASPLVSGYAVPRYRAEGAAFYHVLHGTVPGHQIDFMYCPEVPQGALRQTHVGHLARLIKYIEPRETATYAFALGNLSRDDVQHDPGHGGLAILFALRVPGLVDHAGRDTPPYAHAVIAVDRHLNYTTLLEATTVLYRRFLEREGAEDRRGDFYRSYFRMVRESPAEVPAFLARAIAEHDDLPSPRKSSLGWEYEADESELPRQIAIVYDEPMDFGTLAHWASTLGALLYRSNIKWTTVSTGREIDIAGGTSIRFVPRGEARGGVHGVMHELDALPEDDDELARVLFGARRRGTAAPAPKQGWREAMAAQRTARSEPPPAGEISVDVDVDDAAATIPVASPLEAGRGFDPRRSSPVGGQGAPQRPAAVPGGVLPAQPARAAVPALPASLVSGPPLEDGPFSGKHRETTSKGRWIIAVAMFAALAVVAVVVMAVSSDTEEIDSSSGSSGSASQPSATTTITTSPGRTPAATSTTTATPPAPSTAAPSTPAPSVTATRTPTGTSKNGSGKPVRPGAGTKPPAPPPPKPPVF